MRIENKFETTVISTVGTPSKDGTKTYYKLGILTNVGEVGMLPCSQECIDNINVNKYTFPIKAVVTAEYNDAYNSYRVIGITPTK